VKFKDVPMFPSWVNIDPKYVYESQASTVSDPDTSGNLSQLPLIDINFVLLRFIIIPDSKQNSCKIVNFLTLVLRFYFYAHLLRLGVKKAPRRLSI